jgi:hypothetical protein
MMMMMMMMMVVLGSRLKARIAVPGSTMHDVLKYLTRI